MKKNLVRKEIITKERFDLEFDLIADSAQFAKMWSLGELQIWAEQTGRTIERMPRVEQIEAKEILGVVHEGGERWQVKFTVDTSIYSRS